MHLRQAHPSSRIDAVILFGAVLLTEYRGMPISRGAGWEALRATRRLRSLRSIGRRLRDFRWLSQNRISVQSLELARLFVGLFVLTRYPLH
jgi:hypothetical protein